MQTYLVVRRSAWDSPKAQRDADARSALEATRMAEEIASLRSYALEERDETIGAVCVYRASSPEAIRRHSAAAELPVDEIVKVADTIVGRSEPAAIAARETGEDR